jgi:hypothetical protein
VEEVSVFGLGDEVEITVVDVRLLVIATEVGRVLLALETFPAFSVVFGLAWCLPKLETFPAFSVVFGLAWCLPKLAHQLHAMSSTHGQVAF